MKIFTSISTVDIERVPTVAADLARRGYHGVTTQENRHEPFLPLALAAAAPGDLALLTNLVIAFPRSPMVTASAAWDLQRLSSGRFTLGLGTQVRGHIVRRFSSTWTKPVSQMRDYVRSLRAIFATWQDRVPLDHRGDHYRFDLMTPNFDPGPLEVGPPKLAIGAIGPAMLRLAATECDAVLLHPVCSVRYLAERTLPLLDETLAAAGRRGDALQVVGGGFVATGATDADVHQAREWVRSRVGFYGSTPAYRPILDHHGLGELAERLHHLSKTGGWDAMTPAVGDDALDAFCLAARHDQLAAAVDRHYGGLVDAIGLAPDLPPDLLDDLRRVPTRGDRLAG